MADSKKIPHIAHGVCDGCLEDDCDSKGDLDTISGGFDREDGNEPNPVDGHGRDHEDIRGLIHENNPKRNPVDGRGRNNADDRKPIRLNDHEKDDDNEILSVHNISKSFGGILAVDNCDLSVKRGSVVGLIGPNGAGKSTLFEIISGFQRPDSGKVEFQGNDITGMQAYRVARLGMVRTFQIPRALCRMTVLENMMLGAQNQCGETAWKSLIRRRGVTADDRAIEEKAISLLESFDLIHVKDQYAGSLSGGQKKLLEMARALMSDPKMLLLDEPFAGVNPTLSAKLVSLIKSLSASGMTMLVIEHGIPYIMAISDKIYVLNKGAVMAFGKPNEIILNESVLEAYLGEGNTC